MEDVEMRLRKAKLTDYEAFKPLYEDVEEKYQWLFLASNNDDSDSETSKEDYKDFLELANEEYRNFTFNKYESYLNENKVYIIIDKQKVVGTITLRQMSRGIYRIIEWSMVEGSNKQKAAILNQIKKSFKIRELQAMAFSKKAQKFLINNGFYNTGNCFFSLQIEEE